MSFQCSAEGILFDPPEVLLTHLDLRNMDQDTSEDHRLLNWLQAYTCYMCDRLNFPQNQGERLLEDFLKLPARGSAQQSSASPHEQLASHTGTTNSHYETRYAQRLAKPGLATDTQDQAIIPRGNCDRHDDASTGNNTNHLSNSMAIESSSSLLRLQSYPENQGPGGRMPMDPGQSESSDQLSQPIQAAKDRASIGSIEEYDPLWVEKGHVNSKIVEGFRSRIKFDTLFSDSVIRPGDVLTIQVTIPNNGNDTETEAHITVRPESPSDGQ